MIYFDNAATTLQKPETVAKAVAEAISNLGNAGRGAYDAALHSMRMAYETREMINEFFNGDGPEQVAFMSNATEALNTAIDGMLQPGDHVITTAMEHNSIASTRWSNIWYRVSILLSREACLART